MIGGSHVLSLHAAKMKAGKASTGAAAACKSLEHFFHADIASDTVVGWHGIGAVESIAGRKVACDHDEARCSFDLESAEKTRINPERAGFITIAPDCCETLLKGFAVALRETSKDSDTARLGHVSHQRFQRSFRHAERNEGDEFGCLNEARRFCIGLRADHPIKIKRAFIHRRLRSCGVASAIVICLLLCLLGFLRQNIGFGAHCGGERFGVVRVFVRTSTDFGKIAPMGGQA